MAKKIDTFYKDSKGNTWYLHSTESHRTCKSAAQSTREKSNLKAYESRIGEVLEPSRIFSRFDNNWSRHDNMPRT